MAAAMGTESILLKLSHKRTDEELEKVRKFLLETEGLKQLCATVPELALDELCQYVKIEDYAPEELICREGDPGKGMSSSQRSSQCSKAELHLSKSGHLSLFLAGDKLFFILSGTATEYKSTNAIEKNLHRIDSSEGLASIDSSGGKRSSMQRPHTAGARLSTASRASIASRAFVFSIAGTGPAGDQGEEDQGGGQKKFRGVRSIQMRGLRVDMTEKEESIEDLEERALEEERMRMLSGLYATSPPRSGGSPRERSGASSPDYPKERKQKGDSPPNPTQLRRASQMLRSRAMSRRDSITMRNQRKSRYVSNAHSFGRMSTFSTGSYRSRQFTQTTPALMEHGLKYGYLSCFDSFGELMIFHATEKHKLSVIAGQDGCLILSIDRGTISRIHNYLASEGRQFLTAVKLWASRRVLQKPPAKRHDVDLNTCAMLLSELEFLKNIKIQMRERICKQLALQSFEPNTIICKQGDTGNKIYGILIGKVMKHQKKITGIEEGSELRKKLLNTSSLGQIGAGRKASSARVTLTKSVRMTHLLNQFTMNTTANINANKFKQVMSAEYTSDPSKCRLAGNMLDSVVKIFGPIQEELIQGGTIGSLALLKQNQARHFSCLSSTIVETVGITYDEYNKCVTQFEEEAIKERVDLLGKLALFKNLTKPELKRIIQMGKTVTFAKDQGIMKAEERGKGCYIILSGEASLTYGNAFMSNKLHSGLKVRPKSAVPLRRSQRDGNNASGIGSFDMLQVSLLGPGSYFGEEALHENKVFEYNVIATKKTEVLVLSLRELTYLSANSNGMVETWANKISEWRQERVNTLANTTMKYPSMKELRKDDDLESGNEENVSKSDKSKSSALSSKSNMDALSKVDMKKKLAREKLPKKKNQKGASSMMKDKGQSKKEDKKDVNALIGIVDGQSWRISSSNIFPHEYSEARSPQRRKSGRPPLAKKVKEVTIQDTSEDVPKSIEEEDHVEAVPEIRDDANPVKSRARRNSEILAEMRRTGKARPLSAPPRSSTFQVKMGIPAAFPVWKNRSVTPTGGGYGKMRIRSARGARS